MYVLINFRSSTLSRETVVVFKRVFSCQSDSGISQLAKQLLDPVSPAGQGSHRRTGGNSGQNAGLPGTEYFDSQHSTRGPVSDARRSRAR